MVACVDSDCDSGVSLTRQQLMLTVTVTLMSRCLADYMADNDDSDCDSPVSLTIQQLAPTVTLTVVSH